MEYYEIETDCQELLAKEVKHYIANGWQTAGEETSHSKILFCQCMVRVNNKEVDK